MIIVLHTHKMFVLVHYPSLSISFTLTVVFYQRYTSLHFHHGNWQREATTALGVFRRLWHWPCHNNMRKGEGERLESVGTKSCKLCVCVFCLSQSGSRSLFEKLWLSSCTHTSSVAQSSSSDFRYFTELDNKEKDRWSSSSLNHPSTCCISDCLLSDSEKTVGVKNIQWKYVQ